MSIAFYSGSFDPVSLGHLYIIRKAAKLFDKLIVGVGKHPTKQPFLSQDNRANLIKKCLDGLNNVSVVTHIVEPWKAALENEATVLVRGLRNIEDFHHEWNVASYHNTCGVDTIFIMALEDFKNISSTKIREFIKNKEFDELKKFVPYQIVKHLEEINPRGE